MIILYYTLLCFLFFVMFFCLLFLLSPLFSLIPFVTVRKKVLNEIIRELNLDEKSILYDLGCGDGRVLFAALKTNPDISCVGVEISPFPFLLANTKKIFFNFKNIQILYGNFFKKDISPASHVFLYLFPKSLDELLPKLEKELRVGSRVISCDFEFSKRKPDKILELQASTGQRNKRLYIYDF